jgi:centromere protein C
MDENGAFEDYGQPDDGSPPRDSPQHQTSFTQMDQDDDEDEGEDGQGVHDEEQQQEEDRQTPLPPLRRNKGKERAVLPDIPEEDEDLEDEIAQGLQHVELQHYHDDDNGGGEEEDRTEPEKRQNKKAKLANEEARKPGRLRGKSKKENRSKSLLLRSTSVLLILA